MVNRLDVLQKVGASCKARITFTTLEYCCIRMVYSCVFLSDMVIESTFGDHKFITLGKQEYCDFGSIVKVKFVVQGLIRENSLKSEKTLFQFLNTTL